MSVAFGFSWCTCTVVWMPLVALGSHPFLGAPVGCWACLVLVCVGGLALFSFQPAGPALFCWVPLVAFFCVCLLVQSCEGACMHEWLRGGLCCWAGRIVVCAFLVSCCCALFMLCLLSARLCVTTCIYKTCSIFSAVLRTRDVMTKQRQC